MNRIKSEREAQIFLTRTSFRFIKFSLLSSTLECQIVETYFQNFITRNTDDYKIEEHP